MVLMIGVHLIRRKKKTISSIKYVRNPSIVLKAVLLSNNMQKVMIIGQIQ